MRVHLSIWGDTPPKAYTGRRTYVYNSDSCGVTFVRHTLSGELRVQENNSLFDSKARVSTVRIIGSEKLKGYRQSTPMWVDADLYLEDGRIVEIQTCNRHTIEALLNYVPIVDPRARRRVTRGI